MRFTSSKSVTAGPDCFGEKIQKVLRRAREALGKGYLDKPGGKLAGAGLRGELHKSLKHFPQAVDSFRQPPTAGGVSPSLNAVFRTSDLRSAAMEHLRNQFGGLSAPVMNWHMPAVDRITSDNIDTASPQVDRNAETIKSLSAAISAMAGEMKALGERMSKGIPSVLG